MNLNSKILTVLLFLFLSFFITIQTHAQDGHYWSEDYGNKSMLLSGTVNASVNDLGAVFYNPGRLGLIENPAFVINAKVYEWRTLRVEDGINDGKDLNKSNFGGAPSLVAGTFEVPFLKNHKFAYSFLTRQRTDADFFVRVEEEGDVVDAIPGEELFNGTLNFRTKLKDEWIGLTWSPPLTEKFSVGLSTFVSGINKSSLIGLDLHTLDENNKVAALNMNRSYSYDSYGLLWKLGLAADLSKISLGLTVTTPRINLYNSGSTLFEDYLINVDTTGDGNSDDAYIFNIQSNLQSLYKTPWAIGAGIGIPYKKGILHISAEWYGKVPKYTVMATDPFIGQSTGDTINFVLVDALDPVINFGIGLEWNFNEKLSAYASFATDFSAVTSNITRFAELEVEAANSVFQADFYKFGGGVAIKTKSLELTIGAIRNGASQQIDRPINFPDEDGDPVFDSDNSSVLHFSQWRFVLGFTFPFADKLKDKVGGGGEE